MVVRYADKRVLLLAYHSNMQETHAKLLIKCACIYVSDAQQARINGTMPTL
jgi:hypothetical protein